MTGPVMGVEVTEATTQSITAGGTAQVVFAKNIARHTFFFCNTSDTLMYLRFHNSSDATTALGIPVAVNGGTLILTGSACPTNRVTVLCSVIAKTFLAAEG